MGIAAALKLAKLGRGAARAGSFTAKHGSKVFRVVEMIDATADVGILTDQICRAIMGDNYDPAFHAKVKDVVEAGEQVDILVDQVQRRNEDANQLHAAIDNLNFTLSLDADKNEMIVGLIDKIGAISLTLQDTPTALTWIQGPAARTDGHVDVETLTASIAAVEAYRGWTQFNATQFGFLSAALILKGAITMFLVRSKRRAKRRASVNLDPSELRPNMGGRRNRANAVGSMDMLPAAERKIIKGIRPKTKFTIGLDVTSKAASSVSLAFTIVSIVQRVETRNQAMAALDEQLALYQRASQAYSFCLLGFDGEMKNGERVSGKMYEELAEKAEKLRAAQFRAINIEQSDEDPGEVNRTFDRARTDFNDALLANPEFIEARDFFRGKNKEEWSEAENIGFSFGLDGLIANYNVEAQQKISAIRTIFDEMLNVLSGELNSEDETDRLVTKYVEDKGDKDKIKAAKNTFEGFADVAMAVFETGEVRKTRGFDPIQTTFSTSIQELLSKTLEDAQERLRDIRFASQLYVSAKLILERVDEEERKHAARNADALKTQANLVEVFRKLLKDTGQPGSDADVLAFMEKQNVIQKSEPFYRDAFIQQEAERMAQSEWTGSDLDTDHTQRFQNVAQVRLALDLMLLDLQGKSPEEPERAD